MGPATALPVTEVFDIKGFKLPAGHFFHTGHTWARIEAGGIIRVGMDGFSFKVLGSPDKMELPLMGQELNHGKPAGGSPAGTTPRMSVLRSTASSRR
nr:hypothetical protein [uncultured Desulfobacter sp.]